MRAFAFALLSTVALTAPAFGLDQCICGIEPFTGTPRYDISTPAKAGGLSSFRGITLQSTPDEVAAIGGRLGFGVTTVTYVGQDAPVSAVTICTAIDIVGRADFDRSGQMLRLSLHEGFFAATPVFVRDFADAIFERYSVKPDKADDACFQDMTCFKGETPAREQFLIMRFGTDAQLFVRFAAED